MSNRVDELERKVKDLQAAVNGLTEELVESKERIRQLENAVDVDDPLDRSVSSTPDEATQPTADADGSDGKADTDTYTDADADDSDSTREQRFVDAEEREPELEENLGPEGSDEDAKSAEEKEDETESEQTGSDIIVA
jgi:hypothetical protein